MEQSLRTLTETLLKVEEDLRGHQEELRSQNEELKRAILQGETNSRNFKLLVSSYLGNEPLKRILIIDDDRDTVTALQALIGVLLNASAMVYTADNGDIGIDLAKLYDPEVILLDVRMPGLDGFETCKILKSEPLTRTTPVIFFTGFGGGEEFDSKVLEAGGDGFLMKPVNSKELLAQLLAMKKIKKLNQLRSLIEREKS